MKTAVILNKGFGAWAFQELAENLANNLWITISETPADYNYVLYWDENEIQSCQEMFIPFEGIKLASDKRLLANVFAQNNIPRPDTYLLESSQEVLKHLKSHSGEWCLKYPLGCGASGHKIIYCREDIPQDWPKPYIVQRFIRQENPVVFRLYCAGGKIFGWNARKFPKGKEKHPFVAHAKGAVYEIVAGDAPTEAVNIASEALKATNLFHSFGCVDLIQDEKKNWLVLEVGTDGIFNHVDRQIGNQDLEREINQRVAEAFWASFTKKPWGEGSWNPQNDK